MIFEETVKKIRYMYVAMLVLAAFMAFAAYILRPSCQAAAVRIPEKIFIISGR